MVFLWNLGCLRCIPFSWQMCGIYNQISCDTLRFPVWLSRPAPNSFCSYPVMGMRYQLLLCSCDRAISSAIVWKALDQNCESMTRAVALHLWYPRNPWLHKDGRLLSLSCSSRILTHVSCGIGFLNFRALINLRALVCIRGSGTARPPYVKG